MKQKLLKALILIATFVLLTSLAVIAAADTRIAIFGDRSDPLLNSVFALIIILIYIVIGGSSVYFMNSYLNRRWGLKEEPSHPHFKKLFELHQNIRPIINEYRVLEGSQTTQNLVAFARQKRLAFREQFTLYSDEAQSQILASSKARTIIDLGAVYDVFDDSGQPNAAIKKEFKRSLIRSTWSVYGPHYRTHLLTIREKSLFTAVVRRFWELITDYPFPIKYHFDILDATTGRVVGEYIKITRFRDRYALYLDETFPAKLDKHTWMITAVLLDAMQSR